MKILFLILLGVTMAAKLFSQTISGKIINVNGERIPFASVVIKDSINGTIKEYVLAKNGYYSIRLKQTYQSFAIVVSANHYLPESYLIENPVPDRSYQHDFSLLKDTVVKLPDVTVKAKARPFQINGDTVKYNVSAYRDGSERKIQDIIKKLPGIQVNESTGEIKYKGKSVETVKLDGEDLFSSNYSIGTKNINVDMVEQVQAIENYSDNPLLKGIESGDKVALNLTLKKKKTDYSGSVDAGLGFMNPNNIATDAATNLLGISKKYKSFATLSYNNIGINNTPFDYFSYSPSIERLKEAAVLSKRYIPDMYFDIALDPKRSNINHSLFGSYNSVFKIGRRLSVKTNLYYLKDRINSIQNYVSNNFINGQEFITADKYDIIKVPTQYRGEVELKYNTSPKSLLEYKLKYRKERISTSAEILQNDFINYNTALKTHDNLLTQTLTYTQKISENKALQFMAKQACNNVPQNYSFLPAIYNPSSFISNNQFSSFKKNNLNLQALLLGTGSKSKYSMSFGTDFDDIYFTSGLYGLTSNSIITIPSFNNNFYYKKVNTFILANYKRQVKRWRFMPSMTANYLKQQLLPKTVSDKGGKTENYFIEPSFSIGYKAGSYSALLFTTGYKQKPFTEDYFIANPVYVSSRLIKSNEISLNLQKSKFASLFYIVNDLYRQFQLNFGGSYSITQGNYFSNLNVQSNSTQLIYFYLPEESKTLGLNFLIEKYIPLLGGTVRLSSDYSALFYKNIVNSSSLRNNVSNILTSDLFFKTAFDGKVNFQNIFKHRLLTSKAEGSVKLSNQSFNNNFQVIIKPIKGLFLLASTDYYQPDIKQSNQYYFFLDASVNLASKKKIYDWRFSAKNITNTKVFRQVETNDFSTTIFQTNLLSRYFMVSLTRNF